MPLNSEGISLRCVNWSFKHTDETLVGIGNDVFGCCKVFTYSYFLTLFNDFLSQSRYADVKEQIYTSNQDVPNILNSTINQSFCPISQI